MIGLLTIGLLAVLSAAVDGQTLRCQSGFTPNADGSACEETRPQTCAFSQALALETILPPSLLQGSVGGNGAITLQVRHGLVENRVVTGVRLAALEACNYPGVNWKKTLDGAACLDEYESSIPLATATGTPGCGLTRSEDADFVIWEGLATVLMNETVPGLRGAGVTRELQESLRFRLKFPKSVSASTTGTIFADVRLLSAVTQQNWQAASNNANFGLVSSLQAPFRVESVSTIGLPSGISVVFNAAPTSDCSAAITEACTQTWNAIITPGASVCRLNGLYQLNLTVVCKPGGVCPDLSPVYINVTLSSSDFCAVVEDVVGATLALSSHESFDSLNFAFGNPLTAFFQTDTIYYRLACTSSDGFALQTTTITKVETTNSVGEVVTVFSAGQTPAAGWGYSSRFDGASSGLLHVHELQYVPAVSVFGTVAEDSNQVSTVTVTVALVFANTKKRMIAFEFGKDGSLIGKRQAANGQEARTSSKYQVGAAAVVADEGVIDDAGDRTPGGVSSKMPGDESELMTMLKTLTGLAIAILVVLVVSVIVCVMAYLLVKSRDANEGGAGSAGYYGGGRYHDFPMASPDGGLHSSARHRRSEGRASLASSQKRRPSVPADPGSRYPLGMQPPHVPPYHGQHDTNM